MSNSQAEAEVRARAQPTVNPESGLIDPTVADMVFMAINTPGFKGAVGLNVFVWSDPGAGKTSLVEDVIEWAQRDPNVIVLTRVSPEDMTGIPFRIEFPADKNNQPIPLDKDGNPTAPVDHIERYTAKMPDIRFKKISENPRAVIIFDDATNCTPAVQAATLDLLLERTFDDGTGRKISLKHVAMVAMANHGEGASLTPLLSPVANRFMHVWMDGRDYVQWWNNDCKSTLTVDPEKINTLDAEFPERYERAFALVKEFVKDKQLAAFTVPTPQDFPRSQDYAFASSRTYEFMARWIAIAEHFGVDSQRGIQGCIGDDKAKLFNEWMLQRELIAQAHQNKINWAKLAPSMQERIGLLAAQKFQTTDNLDGLLKSLQRLTDLTQNKSQDQSETAREYLIRRALGAKLRGSQETSPPLSPEQAAMVQRQWPKKYAEIRERLFPAAVQEVA